MTTSYGALLRSFPLLLREEPVLRVRAWTAALVMASFTAFWAAVALRLPDAPFGLDAKGIALFALIGVMASGFLHVLARCRVVADERGLTVVNMFRTRRLAWAQVVRVNLRPGDPWVYLDLDDGATLPVMGIQTSGGRSAYQAAAELRALVEMHSFTERDD